MTRLYSFILLLSISLTTVAQTPNTNTKEFEAKLVRVFEWVLDARFSAAQRQELSRLVENSTRTNNSTDLKTFQDIAKLTDAIDAIPHDREAEARAAIQANILQQLRQQPNDPASKLLLAVYNGARAQNSGDAPQVSSIEREHGEHRAPPTKTTVPAELVGEWQARRGSGSSYYNPNSGSYSAPNATIESYKFFADGTYEHAMLMTNSLYNCTIRVFGRETGKTSVNANRLTITPGPGTLEYTDNCRPQMNSRKATQMDQKNWQWEIGRDEQGVKLCVRDAQGASACYYRQ